MKKCELCNAAARIYCESDQASLCWDCDARVHSANFLVAKHSRNLLCHSCQSPTPWTGFGPRLGPTVSVCRSCFTHNSDSHGRVRHDPDYDEDDSDDDDDDDNSGGDNNDSNDDDDNGDDDGDNQVVPLSCTTPPPPPSSVSSSSDESSGKADYGGRGDRNRSRAPFRLSR